MTLQVFMAWFAVLNTFFLPAYFLIAVMLFSRYVERSMERDKQELAKIPERHSIPAMSAETASQLATQQDAYAGYSKAAQELVRYRAAAMAISGIYHNPDNYS